MSDCWANGPQGNTRGIAPGRCDRGTHLSRLLGQRPSINRGGRPRNGSASRPGGWCAVRFGHPRRRRHFAPLGLGSLRSAIDPQGRCSGCYRLGRWPQQCGCGRRRRRRRWPSSRRESPLSPAGVFSRNRAARRRGKGGQSHAAALLLGQSPASHGLQPSALSPQPSALSPQPSAFSPQPSDLSCGGADETGILFSPARRGQAFTSQFARRKTRCPNTLSARGSCVRWGSSTPAATIRMPAASR